jgi:hypothetical protein
LTELNASLDERLCLIWEPLCNLPLVHKLLVKHFLFEIVKLRYRYFAPIYSCCDFLLPWISTTKQSKRTKPTFEIYCDVSTLISVTSHISANQWLVTPFPTLLTYFSLSTSLFLPSFIQEFVYIIHCYYGHSRKCYSFMWSVNCGDLVVPHCYQCPVF